MKKLPRIAVKGVVPCEPMVRVDFEIDDADFEKLVDVAKQTTNPKELDRLLVNGLIYRALVERADGWDVKKSEDGYICPSCAKKHRGRWPKGHCATQHQGICPFCGKSKGLAALDDYNWPKGLRPAGAWVGRD